MLMQRLGEAVRLHEAGRLDEAEALYRAVLRESPGQPHALHLLGVLAHQAGRHDEALDLIGRALAAHGPHPVFHSNLAAVCLALGRLDEAAAHCGAALQLDPNLADAHNNLGVALRRQGRLAEAEPHFRAAARFGHVDARCNLGAVLQKQGRLPEALAVLREAVRLAPRHAQGHNDLGGALLANGEPEKAIRQLREAVRLRPDFAQAHNNLGLALRNLNRIDEAMRSFDEALRLDPGDAAAHTNRGHALEVQGRIDESLGELREALRLAPGHAMALAGLGRLAASGHCQLDDGEVRALRDLAARGGLPPEELGRVHFALAGVLDRAGAYDEAFEHCRRGNELRQELDRARSRAFDPEAHSRFVDRIIATFTPAYFERVKSFGADSDVPVFIVGMMRSGTTLAEQILASHPQVHGAGELPDIDRLSATLPQPLDEAAARSLTEAHLRHLQELGGGAARVVDKMPFNFLHLGLIATLFPRARVIHCRRDPLDTCLSAYFQNFAAAHPFADDLRHLGRYYRDYERLMAHWTQVLPLPVFELSYEGLTADQEAISRQLVAFCGLAWDEHCLRFHENKRVVRTASVLQVRQPMYRSSVGRWKHYEAHLGPLLESLGRER